MSSAQRERREDESPHKAGCGDVDEAAEEGEGNPDAESSSCSRHRRNDGTPRRQTRRTRSIAWSHQPAVGILPPTQKDITDEKER